MSCGACDKSQDEGKGTYFRFGVSNLYVAACADHLRLFQQMLRQEITVAEAINAACRVGGSG